MGQLSGPTDPTADARWPSPHPRKGFLTDTSICIGCKACEVACKEWNHNPADGELELLGSSYDNTGALGANTWRHVAFIEQGRDAIEEARESGRQLISLGMPKMPGNEEDTAPPDTDQFRWLMSSDVCKHCTHAGCLDVCPTGALMFTSEHELRAEGVWDETRQERTDTICPYCGVGCNLTLHVQDNRIVKVTSPDDHDITRGNLCVKGRFGVQHVNARGR